MTPIRALPPFRVATSTDRRYFAGAERARLEQGFDGGVTRLRLMLLGRDSLKWAELLPNLPVARAGDADQRLSHRRHRPRS